MSARASAVPCENEGRQTLQYRPLGGKLGTGSLAPADYQSLAGFRFHVRRFFAFSEAATGEAGLSSTQYQALLAIKASADDGACTITNIAERLFIRLNSAVELIGRMEAAGLIHRQRATADRRRIEVCLTERGEELLAPLARLHLEQHRKHLPELMRLLAMMACAPTT